MPEGPHSIKKTKQNWNLLVCMLNFLFGVSLDPTTLFPALLKNYELGKDFQRSF